jgi:signal transduction histidine kinase
VPLYVPKSSARVANKDGPGTHLEDQPKRIGVLNFESPLIDAFSEAEEKHLMQLAKSGSVSFDRLQVQESLRELHSAESELAKRLVAGNDWLDDIKAVGSQIHHALSYSHINISVVTLDGNRIRSEYISWSRTKEDSEKFKQMSDHDIASSKDIQADVVKTKQIEVPENNDPRLHPEIHRLFQLDSLIRVYIPLVMGEIVVGTLEAGYRRKFRQYIFERDIQMLKALGDYATAAIWKKRRGRLDELRHEIAAPRQAIMDNAFFLKRNWHSLLPQKISWKLDDILLDGETIDALLDKMEYFLTGHLKETKTEVCNFGGQVISKTIFQQSRKLRAFNADVGRISYKPDGKIVARVDKVKLAAVFSNLFQNAIKYRESDESFRVDIAVETRTDRYLVQVADHGIGIDAGCETRIFDEGFRTPSAIQKASGSGLGLWLSRAYMRDMKGDLVLTQSKNPTTFQIVIPRETR